MMMLMFGLVASAQIQPFGHLTIFSEDGDPFYLILNGERQNDQPETNIRVEELVQPHYNAKIIFEDKTIQEISKNFLQIADVDGIMMDVTYKIRKDKKNPTKAKLNFFSMIPVVQGFVAPSNTYVTRFGHPGPRQVVVQQPAQVVVQQPAVVGGTVTQTTTTTTTGMGGGVSAGVSIGGIGVNVNINDGMMGGMTVTETTTTTTSMGGNQTVIVDQGAPVAVGNPCFSGRPMNQNNFNSALQSIRNQGFDDTRLRTAQQIATSNCLNTNQIVEICKIFGFEETKLTFAKFAYDSCTEPNNYFKVNNVFSFSSSVDELNDYIMSR